jgi:hypothetical protein
MVHDQKTLNFQDLSLVIELRPIAPLSWRRILDVAPYLEIAFGHRKLFHLPTHGAMPKFGTRTVATDILFVASLRS